MLSKQATGTRFSDADRFQRADCNPPPETSLHAAAGMSTEREVWLGLCGRNKTQWDIQLEVWRTAEARPRGTQRLSGDRAQLEAT